MKLRLCCLLLIVIVCFVATRASALDALVFLDQFHEMLKAEPAYRMTEVTTNLDTDRVETKVIEVVKSNAVHTRAEQNGKLRSEMISVGDKTFMLVADGTFKEAPKDLGTSLANLASVVTPLDGILANAREVNLAGKEDKEGTPVSVYICVADVTGVHLTAKIWVSDRDHHVLKMEGDGHGKLEVKSHPELGLVNNRWTAKYDYDPTIKIILPST